MGGRLHEPRGINRVVVVHRLKESCALPSSSAGPAPCRSRQSLPLLSGYHPRTADRSLKASTTQHRRRWTASSTRSNAAQPVYSAKVSRPHLGQQETLLEKLTATRPSTGCHPICASTSSLPDAKSTRASKHHIATCCDDCDERHEVGGTFGSEIGREGATASRSRGSITQ